MFSMWILHPHEKFRAQLSQELTWVDKHQVVGKTFKLRYQSRYVFL